MANTYVLISNQTLGSNQTTVTFSSIPSTYTDLVINISARTTAASSNDSFRVSFNGSTSAQYSATHLIANYSAGYNAYSQRETTSGQGYGYFLIGYFPPSSALANTFGSATLYIPQYTVSEMKQSGYYGVFENNTTTTNNSWFIERSSSLWQNTSAINSISFTSHNSGQIVAGSSFNLYGIKKN